MNKSTKLYPIRNWSEYNSALVRRGSLSLWLDSSSLDSWLDQNYPSRRGRRRTYSDTAITCALLLREVYHLPLRSTQGLLSSIIRLLGLHLPVPDYSTVCRRARYLQLKLSPAAARSEPLHLIVDSTGLKLYGEGEWRVRLHGWKRRRTWRKLHLCIDAGSQQVTSALITNKDVVDPRVLPKLLKQVEGSVEKVYADGAYDSRECYRAIAGIGARAVIPPRKGSTFWIDEYLRDRNSNLKEVRELGVKGWKTKSGYHRRSLIETAIYRMKTLLGDKLKSRERKRQETEVIVRCIAMNRMTELGMAKRCAV